MKVVIAEFSGDGTPDLVTATDAGLSLADNRCPASVCHGDLDADGAVGITDLLALLASWGPCAGCPADLDGNGQVDINDFLALLAAWGSCP